MEFGDDVPPPDLNHVGSELLESDPGLIPKIDGQHTQAALAGRHYAKGVAHSFSRMEYSPLTMIANT